MISLKYIFSVLTLTALIAIPTAAAPRVVAVSTPNELQSALAAPREGDIIELASGTYPLSDLSGYYEFFFILDPGVHFTIRAATPGGAVLDGGNSYRIMEYRVDTPGAEGWVTFEGLVFRNGRTTSYDAGGVMTRGGRSTFIDCTFENNQSLPGTTSGASAGAVCMTAESVAQFVDCVFTANTSDSHGGAMLLGQGSTAFIHRTEFTNNRNNPSGHRPNGLGGAIHVFNGLGGTTSSLFITNSRFDGNQAAFAGGAIMAKGNFASSAQLLESPTVVVVANSTFEGNAAVNHPSVSPASPTEGGGIIVENNASLSVYNSRFLNNSAGLGGAVSSFRGEVSVESSIFRNNTAFGRSETTSAGQGGAIKSHANDNCSDESNYRTGSLSVVDSFFEGNQSQSGGAIFSAGDSNRMFSTIPGCKMGTFTDNRIPVTIDHVTIADCSVDDLIGNHALGGGFYGLLVDLSLTDSMVLDSMALGTDPSNITSSSKGFGGGVAVRKGSRLSITGTTFAGNSADHEGGGLHIAGSSIAAFTDNTFVGNIVSPGGTRTETTSLGAAIFVSPLATSSLSSSGAIGNSTFTDNIGLPIFDLDLADSNGCGCYNLVTYDGNTFHNTTFGDSIYRNTLVPGTLSASELNSLVVNHGGGTVTEKSLQQNNSDEVSPITTSALLAAPESLIDTSAVGDPLGPTESFLAWSWNGGCAELDQSSLPPGTEETGYGPVVADNHRLEVWSGGSCSGTADAFVELTVSQTVAPTGLLSADPIAITGGEESTLAWNLNAGPVLAGMISNEAKSSVATASGSTVVAPPATTGYHLSIVTPRGGAAADEIVYVDENPPDSIFIDGFETGSASAWTATVPQ